ncbi:TlpA family protein disulfide reductase [Sphingobacterium sp. SGG-5]|uniref:TlpA family protein disulfide reductase n=1 Tax=Sphingobacterium sp. SGG-5 TaxID=2710881 RepID=UPI0013EB682D|nr:TlpA disulfide reductase family protein [Sphingobacterium sp. SGG-5]NGM61926.1 TlpA family protein disulfide reductase [Sphingobacterium sp. SGG-5]
MINFNKDGTPMSLIVLIFFVFLLFVLFDVRAQSRQEVGTAEGQTPPQALMVGQKVPEEFWTHEHLFYINGDTVRRTLQEHRGKILVLDFWMSGCMPCLLHQREINHFKSAYPDRLAVVMVNSRRTREDYGKIDRFARSERYTSLGLGGLVSVIEDGYLEMLFPYGSYPSYFWINRRGILQTHTFRNLLDRNYSAPFMEKK